jgi:hypothetical protein
MHTRNLLWWATMLILIAPAAAAAQDLTLTLILVPEITACKPNGYQAGEHDQKCKPLSLPTVRKWANERPSMEATLSPGDNDVVLTQKFSEKLYSLIRKCWPPAARDRWAMVLWISNANGDSLSIKRSLSEDDSACSAASYVGVARVSDPGNAIDHQRGDVFRPSMDAEWTIVMSRQKYAFIVRSRGDSSGKR